MTNAATDSTAEKPGFGDLAEIFYAPSAVFNRRRGGSFGLPLLVICICAGVLSFLTQSLTEPAMQADMLRGMQPAITAGKMTAEQAATSVSFATKLAPVLALVFFLVAPFLVGLVMWLIGKMSSVKQELGVAAMIGTFSMFPRLLGMIAGAVMAAMMPDGALTTATKLSLSPARFVDINTHAGLAQLLTRFDLFIIWAYVLVGIGTMVTARATKGQAIAVAAGTWAVMSIPAILGFLKQG